MRVRLRHQLALRLIILAIVVASLPLARLGGRAASKGGVRYRESVHAVISRIIEYINGIKTFKLYNLTGRRFERSTAASPI